MITHLIQSTVFAALMGLLTLLLRNNRAATRYWVWLAASLKFLVPFSLFVEIGHRLTWTTAPVITQPQLSFVVEQVVAPVYVATPPAPVAVSTNTLPILPALWVLGGVAVLMFWLVRWQRVARSLRRAAVVRAGRAFDRLRRLDARTKLVSLEGSIEPGIFGIARPVLYLPDGISEHLDDAQLDAILLHELTHIRRWDNLTAALHMLVEAVFWFHPLVWWMGARLVEERERACDEEVVRLGSDPEVYAESILKICRRYSDPEVYAESILKICRRYLESPLQCVSGVTGSDLRRRIESIMLNRCSLRLHLAKKAAISIVAISAFAIPVMVGMLNIPAGRAQNAPASPEFEAASIKRCTVNPAVPRAARGSGASMFGDSAMFRTPCISLRSLIRTAYVRYADGHLAPEASTLLTQPLQGGPAWIDEEHYSINAKPAVPQTTAWMAGPMLQALLEDRFKLKIHRESKAVPVYEMVLDKGGAKLQTTKPGECAVVDPQVPAPAVVPGEPLPCGYMGGDSDGVKVIGGTISSICPVLSGRLRRDVIDKTGLLGTFTYHLDLIVGPPGTEPGIDDPAAPDPVATVATALKKLGLKIEPSRGEAEFVVIDHVERPSEN